MDFSEDLLFFVELVLKLWKILFFIVYLGLQVDLGLEQHVDQVFYQDGTEAVSLSLVDNLFEGGVHGVGVVVGRLIGPLPWFLID